MHEWRWRYRLRLLFVLVILSLFLVVGCGPKEFVADYAETKHIEPVEPQEPVIEDTTVATIETERSQTENPACEVWGRCNVPKIAPTPTPTVPPDWRYSGWEVCDRNHRGEDVCHNVAMRINKNLWVNRPGARRDCVWCGEVCAYNGNKKWRISSCNQQYQLGLSNVDTGGFLGKEYCRLSVEDMQLGCQERTTQYGKFSDCTYNPFQYTRWFKQISYDRLEEVGGGNSTVKEEMVFRDRNEFLESSHAPYYTFRRGDYGLKRSPVGKRLSAQDAAACFGDDTVTPSEPKPSTEKFAAIYDDLKKYLDTPNYRNQLNKHLRDNLDYCEHELEAWYSNKAANALMRWRWISQTQKQKDDMRALINKYRNNPASSCYNTILQTMANCHSFFRDLIKIEPCPPNIYNVQPPATTWDTVRMGATYICNCANWGKKCDEPFQTRPISKRETRSCPHLKWPEKDSSNN